MEATRRAFVLGLALVTTLSVGWVGGVDHAAAATADEGACALDAVIAGGTERSPIVNIGVGHGLPNPCPGVGPGSALVLPAGPLDFMYCTLSFVFEDGAGDLYVSTAGHCVDDRLGVPGVGEKVSAHGAHDFGTVVYQWCEGADALGNGCALGTDFALIKVDPEDEHLVHAEMCVWGAPTGGVFTEKDTRLRTVEHFGWGIILGEASGFAVTLGNPATQARQGVGLAYGPDSPAGENTAWFQSPAISGDSGSGVMVLDGIVASTPQFPASGGMALGVLTHISNAGNFAQLLDVSIAKAEADMGVDLQLVAS